MATHLELKITLNHRSYRKAMRKITDKILFQLHGNTFLNWEWGEEERE